MLRFNIGQKIYCLESTYKELKQSVLQENAGAFVGLESTYKELKHLFPLFSWCPLSSFRVYL